MFQEPDYTRTVSARLSEVLADIGVNERMVTKRRRTWLLVESLNKIFLQFIQENKIERYILGSQSEGTTTPGLFSDIDNLLYPNDHNVIQDWTDWQPGVRNYFMIQDETVSPGYCLLQCLRDDVPLPYMDVRSNDHFRDIAGRIVLRNEFMSASAAEVAEADNAIGGGVRHGPAHAIQGQHGCHDNDIVGSLPCKSWPLQARQWLNMQSDGQWPSDEMKRYCSNTGCFVVGIGSKGSENEELEWRISTSLAERCLMFNLNITQIQCYVLMKMILKSYIKPHYGDSISSFMRKTVLLHLIANTCSNFWRDTNLLVCLSLCLFVLYNSIRNENCPHFIIPGNNLMAGHISQESKPHILEMLQYIINSKGTALLGIECDNVGARLQQKLNNLCPFKVNDRVSGCLLQSTAYTIDDYMSLVLIHISNNSYETAIQKLLKYISKLVIMSNQSQGLNKTVCILIARQFCTTLGTVLASLNIQQHNSASTEALRWISLGLNTDVSSGKLKLASMFYCIGDGNRTEIALRDIEESYDLNIVEPVCRHCYISNIRRRGFNAICGNHNEDALQYATASCVKFLSCEINCVPHELQYEIFRSTLGDLAFRGTFDNWMNWAVVDSLPCLYFLQYKT